MRFPRHWDMIISGCGLFLAQLRMVNPTVFTLWQEAKMSPPYRIYGILRKESFPKLIFRNSNWRWLNLFPNQFMVVSASTLHLHTPFFGSVGLTIFFLFFLSLPLLGSHGFLRLLIFGGFLKPLIHLPSQELWKILLPHAKAGHVLDSCGIEAWVSWHATRTWSPMYTNVKWGVLYVMVCKWKHEVMHPYCDVAQKWYHITKVASNHQILCFSQIPTRARRARPPNSNCHERAERVLVFHEKQTSPKASLNFKGSLQHPNLSLPHAFSTNPTRARRARPYSLKPKPERLPCKRKVLQRCFEVQNIILLYTCFAFPQTLTRAQCARPKQTLARAQRARPKQTLARAQRARPKQTL